MDFEFVRSFFFFNHHFVKLGVVQIVYPIVRIWIKVEISLLPGLSLLSWLSVISRVFLAIVSVSIIISISKLSSWFILSLRSLSLSTLFGFLSKISVLDDWILLDSSLDHLKLI